MGGQAAARVTGGREDLIWSVGATIRSPEMVRDTSELDFVEWSMVEPLPSRLARFGTRLFDLGVGIFALILCLPAFACIAAVVKLTTPGPVFFRQKRLGRSGESFSCLKFRTMTKDADAQLGQMLKDNPNLSAEFDGKFKLREDPRVTRVGRHLRATSLDELPQLLNVICGKMSIVGPRPIVSAEVVRYGDQLPLVLRVKPGMTGLWQVSGRNNLTYEERVQLDAYYALNRRLREDLRICLRTICLPFSRVGAY